ncbi:MAG: GNAT family N-acetyltransferase [Rubrivivax sp.]
MSDTLDIRPERPDQPDVVALLDALDRYLMSLYALEANHILSVAELLAPEISFFVARRQGVAVGTGAVRRRGGQDFGEIKRMLVAPKARGAGVGARMLATLEQHLISAGCTRAMLETGAAQTEAVRLYERAGYARCASFNGYPDNGLSVFYAKRLEPVRTPP